MLHMARLCETVKIHEELFCESRRPQDAPHALSIFVPQTTQCKTCDPLSRSDQSLKLPSGNSLKALRCFKRSSKPAHVIIKLAWNLLKFDVLPPGDHIHLRAATPSRTKQRLPWEVLLSFPAWSRPSSKPVPLSSCEPKASQSASSHTTLGSFQYVYLWNHTSNRKQPKELPQQLLQRNNLMFCLDLRATVGMVASDNIGLLHLSNGSSKQTTWNVMGVRRMRADSTW